MRKQPNESKRRGGRKPTGNVRARQSKRGTVYSLRFMAYEERRFLNLGSAEEGWTRERAEAELRHVLADVERGIWEPPRPEPMTGRLLSHASTSLPARGSRTTALRGDRTPWPRTESS